MIALVDAPRIHRWIADPASEQLTQRTFSEEVARRTGGDLEASGKKLAIPHPLGAPWLQEHASGDAVLCWPVERLGDAKLEYPFEPLLGPQRMAASPAGRLKLAKLRAGNSSVEYPVDIADGPSTLDP